MICGAMVVSQRGYLPEDESICPERGFDDFIHCGCWWDGDPCCACNAPAMTDEQKIAQGMGLTD